MAEATDYESDSDTMSFDSDERDFSCYEEVSRPTKQRKCFRKSIGVWDIDKHRLLQLQKLQLMKLPLRTIDVLSKLIINHQITEIGKLSEFKKGCMTITAKVNLENQNFRELTDEDVVLEVFTRKNHTKPDLEAAKNFDVEIYYKNINKKQNEALATKYSYYEPRNHFKNFAIFRIDSIVVIPSKPKTSLMDMIKKQPHRRLELFGEVLFHLKKYRMANGTFWAENGSVHNIYYNETEGEWLFLNRSVPNTYDYRCNHFPAGIVRLVKVFNRFGVPMEDLHRKCSSILSCSHRSIDQSVLQELCEKLDWS